MNQPHNIKLSAKHYVFNRNTEALASQKKAGTDAGGSFACSAGNLQPAAQRPRSGTGALCCRRSRAGNEWAPDFSFDTRPWIF
jgi:hypothetical protein